MHHSLVQLLPLLLTHCKAVVFHQIPLQEKMRANEAQVADLTARLEALELEKCRLESRARLLEQVVSLNLTHEARLHTNKVGSDTGWLLPCLC